MKSCSKCGKIHPYNYKCDVGRTYAGGAERRERSSYAWTKKSKEIRDKAQGLCEVCKDKGIYTYKGLEVHHIVKIKDNPTLLLDNYNLICLCIEHHKEADRNELSIDYLKDIAKRREGT